MAAPTFSYTYAPKTVTVDMLRLLLGDTDVTGNPVFSNEELEYFYELGEENRFMAAYHACQSAASKFSQMADKSMGPMQVNYSQVSEAYRKQAEVFFRSATARKTSIPVPYSATTSTTPYFYTGMMADDGAI